MTEHFAPRIVDRDGCIFTPTGFEWVLAFAFHGCEWAIIEASKPEFREHIIKYKEQENAEWINKELDRLKLKIKELKEE